MRRFRPTEMAALSKMSRPCMTPSEKDMVRHMYHNLKKKPSEIAESFPMASVVGAFISATAAHRIMLVLRNKGRLVEMALVANSAAAAKKAVIAVRKQLLAAVSS